MYTITIIAYIMVIVTNNDVLDILRLAITINNNDLTNYYRVCKFYVLDVQKFKKPIRD